ncbi:uncharacterized protein LOC113296360 [Papaver somniferum]|uniref:uncharacterized protein LOC113296360 n=1 Tax=Papaver somniferum TaxID=3469 RepID=UPI000E6FE7CF|nr:uncharacterized protein LOC113296360 [Papaver somniferum]
MLRQKARNKWLLEGASNSSFLHNSIRIRRGNNTISELVDDAGNTITDGDQLCQHVVSYYENKFNGVEMPVEDQIFYYDHLSITLEEQQRMDSLLTVEDIQKAVFDLGADSALAPDGFSGCFHRHCWEIIQHDLFVAILFCWQHKFTPSGDNSSLIILLAKVRGANSFRNFRPIGLSNFFFKIFTKILTTRLGSVLEKLVSEEQVAFMKERNIHENISLASEMVNELHIKSKDGDLGMKLDISQAFDTVSWSFWFGGFFKINRGLRQGDTLSSLIFVLIEDVLSRNISKLFKEKKMSPMVTRNGISPTHLFFANDIMIFCKGNMKSVRNLVSLLEQYHHVSGQTVCRQKSKIYYDGGPLSRRRTIFDFLGMSLASFPDCYLGVQIMPGAVRYRHICTVIDKIKNQLAVWKGKMLSFHDRVVLVKIVIASYFIHNMEVYKWPLKFIQQCERVIQNFIWSGDSGISRAFVVGFDKVCSPLSEGGLGLTRLSVMNKALVAKLLWNIKRSHKKWARFLEAKYTCRDGRVKDYGIKSTILPGVHWVDRIVAQNTKSLTSDGRCTSLYFDIWLCHGPDFFWMPDLKGVFSVSSAREIIRQKYPVLPGVALLWRKAVHPMLAAQRRKIMRGARATLDKVQSGFKISLFTDVVCAARGKGADIAGAGVVVRDEECNVLGTMSIGLGITNSFLAELYGIIVGL